MEDCLPAICIASPLVEHKNASKVRNIDHTLQQAVWQIVQRSIRKLWSHINEPSCFRFDTECSARPTGFAVPPYARSAIQILR